MKLEFEYIDANDAVRKFTENLRKLGLLERFMINTVGYMDVEPLRRLDDAITERIEYLENLRLQSWDDVDLKKYLAILSPDGRRFLALLKDLGGKVNKTTVKERFRWGNMKVAGVVAGMTRIAKSMDRKPLVVRTYIRINADWDVLYTISDDKYLELLGRLLKEKS